MSYLGFFDKRGSIFFYQNSLSSKPKFDIHNYGNNRQICSPANWSWFVLYKTIMYAATDKPVYVWLVLFNSVQ